jgi:hypothetical protein
MSRADGVSLLSGICSQWINEQSGGASRGTIFAVTLGLPDSIFPDSVAAIIIPPQFNIRVTRPYPIGLLRSMGLAGVFDHVACVRLDLCANRSA